MPGVNAQSIDALGVNEQSLSISVRGFNTTRLGYTLDGMPLGDGAYNNYNGLTISRALIAENLGRADLSMASATWASPRPATSAGAITYVTSDPRRELGLKASQSLGSDSTQRTFLRVDTGEHAGFSAYVSGMYSAQAPVREPGRLQHLDGQAAERQGRVPLRARHAHCVCGSLAHQPGR